MENDKIIISGTGCALADYLYTHVNFNSPAFQKYRSHQPGDGGLSPGKLVFTEDLEKYAGKPYLQLLNELTGNTMADSFNVGGPGLVSLIHASQMLEEDDARVCFYGALGKDVTAEKIFGLIKNTPLDLSNYRIVSDKASPFTDVLSDRNYLNGHGERTFINNIGAAFDYSSDWLDDEFFNSDIVCFGGTALVPPIHEQLTTLLKRAKKNRSITIVNTVYDFLNEKRHHGNKWPLISGYNNYNLIDLLIMDAEEALKISGEKSLKLASVYFMESGVASFVITNGAEDILAFSNGEFFHQNELLQLPVCKKVTEDLRTIYSSKGDTTGCGDNFAGGLIASVASQLKHAEPGNFDFMEALCLGIVSGGVACFYKGGTYFEKSQGEKQKLVYSYYGDYLDQIRKNEPYTTK